MAIIVGGHETGLLDSSYALLNRNDRTANNDPGSGNQLFVNVSNGNLLLQERDVFLPSLGEDYGLTRTYNVRGRSSDAHQHEDARWTFSTTTRLTLRNDGGDPYFEVEYGDGAIYQYLYNATTGLYESVDGAGAYETIEDLGVNGNTEPAYILTRADQTRLAFDKQGHLLSSEDTNGVRTTYIYASDRLVQIQDDTGHTLDYVYQNGLLFQVVDETEGVLVEYHYTNGLLSEVIDRYGHSTQYFYTNNGFLERVVLPNEQVVDGVLQTFDNRELNFQYETVNWRGGTKATAQVLTQLTDAEGNVTSFEYAFDLVNGSGSTGTAGTNGNAGGNGNGNGKGHFDPGDGGTTTTTTTTDDKFFMGGSTRVIDALGNNRAYSNDQEYQDWRVANGYYQTYDANAAATDPNVQAQVDAIRAAHSLYYTYRADGYITEVVDQQGYHTLYAYDDKENLIAVTDRNGWAAVNSDSSYYRALRAELGYTDIGGAGKLVADLTDPEKDALIEAFTSHFTYDERGNLLSSEDNEGNTTTYTYTAFNKLASRTSALGNALVTSDAQQYQDKRVALGYAALVADLSGADTQAILDLHTTTYSYDANQNLIERVDAGGDITRFAYDVYGNQTQTTVYLDPADQADPTKQQVTQYFYDAFGNNIETVDGEGNHTFSEYDHFGNLVRFTDGNGGITTFTYDPDNRLLTVTDPEGHATVNTYDAVGNRTSVTDANGHTITRIYDRNNLLIATIDPSDSGPLNDRITQFQYDVVGNRTSTVDAEGRETRFSFNARRELVEVITAEVAGADGVTPTSYTSTFAYDGEGNRIRTSNNRGFTTDILYTGNGLVRQQTDPNGQVTRLTYDANSNQIQIVAGVQLPVAKRQTISFSYDEEDQLVRQTDAEGNVTTFAYDAPGNRIAVTDANGNTTEYEYDHNNRLVREVRPEVFDPVSGTPVRYSVEHIYDANGNEIETVDENGHSTRFSFDRDDRLVMVEDGNGIKTVFAYDSRHNRTSVQIGVNGSVDVTGHVVVTDATDAQVTSFVYDEFNQLVAQVDGLGNALAGSDAAIYQDLRQQLGYAALVANLSAADQHALRDLYTSRYTYDRVGNQLDSIDHLGRSTVFEYDALNRLVTRTDALGNSAAFRYDGNGNRVEQLDALGRSTALAYDSVDRLTDTTDSLGVVTHRDYDSFGNLTAETRAAGTANARTATFEYDLNNRVIAQTDPEGHTQSYEYDAVGNRLRVTDARGNATNYVYDALNRNIRIIDPLSFETRFEYDGVGNRISLIDARGGATRFDYDAGNRRIAVTDAEGRVSTFAYDVRGNRIELRTATGTGDEEVTTFEYDAQNNLRAVIDAEGNTTSNDYDREYNRIATTDGNGHTTVTAFDAIDRVIRVTDAEGQVTQYSYDAVGNRLTQTDALGRVTGFTYDANDRLIVQTAADGVQTVFAYDEVGNRVSITRAANTAEAATDTYVYNLDDQLVSRSDTLGNTVSYVYDENHNRTVVTDANGNATTYTYDANNRVSSILDPEGNQVQYAYDGNGNRVQVTDARGYRTTTYYNANNEVTLAVDAEGYATSFSYDHNGNVVSQTLHQQALALPVDPAIVPVPATAPDDQTTALEYDKLNRVTARNDAEGYRTEYSYDAVGNRLEARQSRDLANIDVAVTRSYYDDVNRTVATVSAEGYLTTFAYDALGNRTAQVIYDQPVVAATGVLPQPAPGDAGRAEAFAYDAVNRLVRSTSALGVNTDFEYDARGNRTAIVEAAGSGDERRTAYRYDSADRLIETEDALNVVTHLNLDGNGNVVDRLEAFGTPDQRQTHFAYDGNNRVINQTQAVGTAVEVTSTLDYDGNGNLIARTDAAGTAAERTSTSEYDGNNRRTAEVNGEGERTESTYDGAGNRTSLTLAPGLPEQRTNTFAFDRDNRLVATVDGEGVRTEYRYDGAGNKVETVQAVGLGAQERHSLYDYDLDSRLVQITDPLGFVTTYEYDVLGNQTRIVDANGGVQVNTFDAIGRHVSTLSAGDILTVNTYDLRGNTLSTTQSFGDGSDARTTTYTYDLLDRQVLVTDPEGYSTRIDYDDFGNQTLVTHALYLLNPGDAGYDAARAALAFDQSNQFSFDSLDRLEALTDAEGNITLYGYDAVGNRTSLTEAANSAPRTTVYSYDKADRLVEAVTPEGGITRSTYDQTGNRVAEDALQSAGPDVWIHRTFAYDGNARMTAAVDAYGVRTEFDYDALGNQTAVRSAAGTPDERLVRMEYDLDNRKLADIDGEGGRTEYAYDHLGNRTKVTDAEGRVARFYFDSANQLVSILDAEGYINEFAYDSAGNRTDERVFMTRYTGAVSDTSAPVAVTSVEDRLSSTVFDGNSRAVIRTEADGSRSEFTYDAAGNLRRELQYANTSSPRELAYGYDLDNRLRFLTDVDGTVTEFQYDGANNKTLERISNTADPNAVRETRFEYDLNNREVRNIFDQSGLNYVQETAYDKAGNVIVRTDARGQVSSFEYDLNNRVVARSDALGNTTRIDYDRVGNQIAVTDPRGNVTDFVYDNNNRVRFEIQPQVAVFTVGGGSTPQRPTIEHRYDAVGNEVQVVDAAGNLTTRYFDNNDRLSAEINGDNAFRSYAYNAAGDQVRETLYMDLLPGTAHDPAVLPTGSGETRTIVREYDLAGRLTHVTYPAIEITALTGTDTSAPVATTALQQPEESIAYDAYGNAIVSFDPNGNRTVSYYDDKDRLIAHVDPEGYLTEWEYDAQDNVLEQYIYTTALDPVTVDPAARPTSPAGDVYHVSRRYDAASRLIEERSPMVEVYDAGTTSTERVLTTYTYDANNNQTSRTLAAGTAQAQTEHYYYDAVNRQVAIINAASTLHLFQYDANGNQTLQKRFYNPVAAGVDPNTLDGTLTDFATLVAANDSDQAKTLVYDALNRLTAETDLMGLGTADDLTKTSDYDTLGRRTRTVDEDGYVTQFSYNALGRTLSTIGADGNGTVAEYDAAGNQTRVYTGQLFDIATGTPTSLAVAVDPATISATLSDQLSIGWQLPAGASVQTYVVYGTSSVPSAGIGNDANLGYGFKSAVQGSWFSTDASVAIDLDTLGATAGTELYFRVVSSDIAGNLAWGEEQTFTVPPRFTAVSVAQPAADTLTFTVDFDGSPVAPTLRYGNPGALNGSVSLVDQGGGQYSATISGLTDPQALSYRIDWQDVGGGSYQSGEVPTEAQGEHTGALITAEETSVVVGSDTRSKLNLDVQLPADLIGRAELVTAEWSLVGSDVTLGSTGVLDDADPLNADGLYSLIVADAEPLAAGDYQIVLRAALADQDITLDVFTVTLGGGTPAQFERQAASWDRPAIGDSALVVVGGERVSTTGESGDTRLVVNANPASGTGTDFSAFYGDAVATDHTTSINSTEVTQVDNGTVPPTVTVLGYDLGIDVALDAAEAATVAGDVHLAWRNADTGIDFANDVALTAAGNDYSTTLPLLDAGQYDVKIYYTDTTGNEVIVDWLRVDTADALTEITGKSISVLASETDGSIDRTASQLLVDPGLYVGPVTDAGILALNLSVTGTGEFGDARTTDGNETGYYTENTYNALNVLTGTNAQTGIWRTFGVDAKGNVLATYEYGSDPQTGDPLTSGPLLRERYSAYDGRDRVIADFGYDDTNAGGRAVTRYEYDLNDNVTRQIDEAHGLTVDRTYSALGSQTSQSNSLYGVASYAYYDRLGNLVREVDELGNARDKTYDAAGRVVSEIDGEGHTIDYTYDAFDRRTRVVNANGDAIAMTYDQRDRLLQTTAEAVQRSAGGSTENLITTYAYDGRNNRTVTTDANGHTIEQVFDALGRPVDTITYQNGQASHERRQYDAYGNLVVETDGAGRATSHVYGAFGRINQNVDTGSRAINFGYDALGNLISETGLESKSIDKTYDVNGRVLSVTDHATGVSSVYTYNLAGDRLTEVITTPDNAHDRNVSYSYDALGQMIRWADSVTGLHSNTQWDAAGNQHRVYTDVGYDPKNENSANDPNFRYIDHVYSYDGNNRATLITQRGVDWRAYGYDAAGNRTIYTEYDDTGSTATDLDYQYNSLGWVLKATTSAGASASDWSYDKVGNVTTFVNRDNSGSVTTNESYSYWENNRQYRTVDHKEGQTTTQNFDIGGRLLSIAVNGESNSNFTYNYTADGRISTIRGSGKKSSGTTTYQYDANDNPVFINQGKGDNQDRPDLQRLVYNNDSQILYQFDDNGKGGEAPRQTEFAYANGNPVGESGTDRSSNVQAQVDTGRYNLVTKLGEDYPGTSITDYTVRSGDSLQSIAAAFYGNPSLWFVIAEANGLDATQQLKEGQRIQLPNTIKTGRLTADTHVVYDQGEIVGSTLPNLKSKKSGCGGFLAILIIVVIAVVAFYAVGALAGVIGNALFAGTSLAGTTFATVASYAIAGAVVGAAASIVQQGLFIALGYQDKFSWKSVAAGAISGALSGAAQGVGVANLKSLVDTGQGIKYAETAARALQVASAASKQLIENGKITSWTSLATAALGPIRTAGLKTPLFESALISDTALNFITPWAELAEKAIRNDGDLSPLDWANAVGSTLTSALSLRGGGSETVVSNGTQISLLQGLDVERLAVNLAVGGVLSAFDKDAAQSYLETAIGSEVGQLIGQRIVGATGLDDAATAAFGSFVLGEGMKVKADRVVAAAAAPAGNTESTRTGDPEKLTAPTTEDNPDNSGGLNAGADEQYVLSAANREGAAGAGSLVDQKAIDAQRLSPSEFVAKYGELEGYRYLFGAEITPAKHVVGSDEEQVFGKSLQYYEDQVRAAEAAWQDKGVILRNLLTYQMDARLTDDQRAGFAFPQLGNARRDLEFASQIFALLPDTVTQDDLKAYAINFYELTQNPSATGEQIFSARVTLDFIANIYRPDLADQPQFKSAVTDKERDFFIREQTEQLRQINQLGIALAGPVLGAPAIIAQAAGAPPGVVDSLLQIGVEVGGALALGAGAGRISAPALRPRGSISGDAGAIRNRLTAASRGDIDALAELNAARALRAQGINVHFRTAAGDLGIQNVRTSDFLVGGELGTGNGGLAFEVFAPSTANAGRVVSQAAKKLGQSDRLILNLDNTSLAVDDLSNIIGRVNNIPGLSRPLQEVIFIQDQRVVGRLVNEPGK